LRAPREHDPFFEGTPERKQNKLMNINYDSQLRELDEFLNMLKVLRKDAIGPGATDDFAHAWRTIAETSISKTAKLSKSVAAQHPDLLTEHIKNLRSKLAKGIREIRKLSASGWLSPEIASKISKSLAPVLKNRTTLGLVVTAAVAGLGTGLASGSRAGAREQGENTNEQSAAAGTTRKARDVATELANRNGPTVYTVMSV
jgi:hypothetical protein